MTSTSIDQLRYFFFQEQAVKVILFILSLHLDVQKPFLVISTSTALSVWEAEFLHLAPSANIVVYYGNRDVRSSIRSLEFYNEGGGIMFNVLLSSADVVVEVLFFTFIPSRFPDKKNQYFWMTYSVTDNLLLCCSLYSFIWGNYKIPLWFSLTKPPWSLDCDRWPP